MEFGLLSKLAYNCRSYMLTSVLDYTALIVT